MADTGTPTWGSRIGKFLSNDALPVALGMGAQAAMEEHQTSWPAIAGRSIVDLGRSNIAAKAAMRQAEERGQLKKMLASVLSGKGSTEAGTRPGAAIGRVPGFCYARPCEQEKRGQLPPG